jgi:RND family efflux transporter MFP subunit
MLMSRIAAAALIASTLAGCDKPEPSASPARPVRTVTVERGAAGETVSLTGHVRAKDEASLAFRLDGRVVERLVNMGDEVRAAQVVARLDARDQENAVRTAEAKLAAVEALLTQARLTFARQQALLKDGWTSRAKFDEAEQKLRTVQAEVDSARAQLRVAQDQLDYAVLHADAPGVVAAVGAEPGEVVRAGQMIVQVARQGGRDAVFDVPRQLIQTGPRDPMVEIALADAPTVKATGRVREVAPQADSATRTFQVKVGITDPPEAMRLGSTVTGRLQLAAPPGVEVPASSLTEANGRAAVWIVDPQSQTVSLRNVDVLRYDPTVVVISQGLKPGDVVVTAGAQALRPGQQVRLLGGAR